MSESEGWMFNLSWYKVSIAKNIETVCGLTENKQTNKQTNKQIFFFKYLGDFKRFDYIDLTI